MVHITERQQRQTDARGLQRDPQGHETQRHFGTPQLGQHWDQNVSVVSVVVVVLLLLLFCLVIQHCFLWSLYGQGILCGNHTEKSRGKGLIPQLPWEIIQQGNCSIIALGIMWLAQGLFHNCPGESLDKGISL